MNITEARSRLSDIRTELDGLDPSALDADGEVRFDELTAEADTLVATIEKAEARSAARAQVTAAAERADAAATVAGEDRSIPNVNVRAGSNPFDLRDLAFDTPGSEIKARALSAIEETVGDLPDAAREAATRIVSRTKDPKGEIALRVLATGTPEYRSAFQKVAGGQAILLSEGERAALARAQSLTNASGGFAVPFTLDPTIIYTGDGAANAFRQVSRIESIVTDNWNGVTSSGVSGGYAAEASEVGDDSATLAQPSITPARWDVFVPFSFEIGQDWANLEGDLRMLVEEKRDEFDTTAFTTGSGTNAPKGIITALDGSASEVAQDSGEAFTLADVYNVEAALPPRYRRTADQAVWMYALPTAQTIRQFDTGGGNGLWERLGAGTPSRLLGYRGFENSAMASNDDIDAAETSDNHILVLGDFRNYVIVDRVGLNVELVPHLFHTSNNRPSGQRGFLAWGRTGADCVNANAFAVLNVATTA